MEIKEIREIIKSRSLITGQVGHTDIDCTEKHYHEDRKSPETKIKILSEIPDFTA